MSNESTVVHCTALTIRDLPKQRAPIVLLWLVEVGFAEGSVLLPTVHKEEADALSFFRAHGSATSDVSWKLIEVHRIEHSKLRWFLQHSLTLKVRAHHFNLGNRPYCVLATCRTRAKAIAQAELGIAYPTTTQKDKTK